MEESEEILGERQRRGRRLDLQPVLARDDSNAENALGVGAPAAHRANVLFRAHAIIKERTEDLAELEAATTA